MNYTIYNLNVGARYLTRLDIRCLIVKFFTDEEERYPLIIENPEHNGIPHT